MPNKQLRKMAMLALSALSLLLASLYISAEQAEKKANRFGVVDLQAAIDSLPDQSDDVILDKRLYDGDTYGIRVFRIYKPVPQHFHRSSDAMLYLLEGKVRVSINKGEVETVEPGSMMYWNRGVVHAVVELLSETATILAIDVPVRNPKDVIFLKEAVKFIE